MGMTWVLVTIAVCGGITNSLSLHYFLALKDRRVGARLLRLLTLLDLAFCTSCVFLLTTGHYYRDNHAVLVALFTVFNFLYGVLLEMTALVTCLLTVIRTVCLWCPFHRTDMGNVCGVCVGYLAYLVVRGSVYLYTYHTSHPLLSKIGMVYDTLGLTSVTVILVTVVMCNLLSLIRLSRSRDNELGWARITRLNREACKTVMMISAVFCVCNISFLIVLGFQVGGCSNGCVARWWYELGMICVPLNSALNPLIYFTRKRQMRAFLRQTISSWFSIN